ncbi:MAG TPA: hypothetical protein VLL52_06555 [Anaerolineae bacterium]|nr:hypothetical protein [Anaerolineae bacterium]
MIKFKKLSRLFFGLALLTALALFSLLSVSPNAQAAGTSSEPTHDVTSLIGTGTFNGFGIFIGYQPSPTAKPTAYGLFQYDVDAMYTTGGLTGAITQARLQIVGGNFGATMPMAVYVLDDVAPWNTWTEGAPPTDAQIDAAFTGGAMTLADTPEEGSYDSTVTQVYNFLDTGADGIASALEARRSANGGSGVVTFAVAPTGGALGSQGCLDDREGNSEGGGCPDYSATTDGGPRLHIADAGGPLAVTMSDAGSTTSAVNPVLIWVLFGLLLTFSAGAIVARRMGNNEELS